MSQSAPNPAADTFAANRAHGRIELAVSAAEGATRVARLHEAGSLRVRFPHVPAGSAAEAVILNTAGGMAGGDRFSLDLTVGSDASLAVTTAAAEKVYRSLGPATNVDIRIAGEAGASLAWLPQETILFDRARLSRTITVDMAANARLALAEAIVFGRAAMGERVKGGALHDRWRIRRGGRLIYAEGVRLEDDIAGALARPASGNGAAAMATVLMIPGDDGIVAAVRAREGDFLGEVGASAWNGLASVRLIAREATWLRHDLALVIAALGWPLPRLWLN